jgi:hypothetical protein
MKIESPKTVNPTCPFANVGIILSSGNLKTEFLDKKFQNGEQQII